MEEEAGQRDGQGRIGGEKGGERERDGEGGGGGERQVEDIERVGRERERE